MKSIGRVKMKRKHLLIALVIAGMVCGVVGYIGYTLLISSRPARQVLTEEEVRRLITEHPGILHLEVKPETIEFLSLELVPIEESPLAEEIGEMENFPDKVWVVKYECDGRVWLGTIGPPPPFTRKFVRVVIDAYTGQTISSHTENIEPEQLITFEEACNVFSQYFGGGRWEDFIELYGEDVEYSFKVYRKDNLAGYFLYRASNGTLFEADYESGEVGKALRQIIVPEDKEGYYVWEIIDLSPEYGPFKDKYIDARNGEILLGLPRGERGPSPSPPPTPVPLQPPKVIPSVEFIKTVLIILVVVIALIVWTVIVRRMKGKHLLMVLVIVGILCGIIGYISYASLTPPPPPPMPIPAPTFHTMSVSAFSRGVRLEVTVNNTNPSIGDVVGIEASITNVNSTERLFWGGRNLMFDVLNSDGVRVYGLGVVFTQPTPPIGPVELTKNETYSETLEWKAETSPDFNVEVKSGETYYIIVRCKFKTDTGEPIELSTEPIRVRVWDSSVSCWL